MIEYSIYDLMTGLFTGETHGTTNFSDEWLHAITPPGKAAVLGVFNRNTHRVDIETGKVVQYIPPSPGPQYEWNPTWRRWELTVEEQRRIDRRQDALTKIDGLEAKQLRAMRELALDQGNVDARRRLQEIEVEIQELRVYL